MSNLTLIVFIIGIALLFDFINGFHDSANSIATVVGTRVLPPGVRRGHRGLHPSPGSAP